MIQNATATVDGIENSHTVSDPSAPDEKVATDSDPSGVQASAHISDGERMGTLLELIVPEDTVAVNPHESNRGPMVVTDATERPDSRVLRLTGNGTVYTLNIDRDDHTGATLTASTVDESVEFLRVLNRNAFNVWQLDGLLGEEVPQAGKKIYDRRRRGADHPISANQKQQFLTEIEYAGDALDVLQAAVDAQLAQLRSTLEAGPNRVDFDYWRWQYANYRALQAAINRRDRDNGVCFYYGERGWVGAALDYTIEDSNLDVSDALREAALALRERGSSAGEYGTIDTVETTLPPEV